MKFTKNIIIKIIIVGFIFLLIENNVLSNITENNIYTEEQVDIDTQRPFPEVGNSQEKIKYNEQEIIENIERNSVKNSKGYKIWLYSLIAIVIAYFSFLLIHVIIHVNYLYKIILDKNKKNSSLYSESAKKLLLEKEAELDLLRQEIKRKKEFISNTSHEIKTPVQGITSLSRALKENWPLYPDEKKHQIITEIANNSSRLFDLVSEILDLSKIENNSLTLNLKQTDLNHLVKSIMDEFNTIAKSKNIELYFKTNLIKPITNLDEIKMLQVLRNLLSNAVKFTDQGKIGIFLTQEQKNNVNYFKISVIDNGIGIPEGEVELIFEPFFQSSKTVKKNIGTGLGLSICKKIITLHNGMIWAQNNQDQGTTFNIMLPILSGKEDSQQQKEQINALPKNINAEKKYKIVLLDDERVCHLSIELMLQHTIYDFVGFEEAEEAISYINNHLEEVDILLLDLMMPGINGLDVIKEVRSNKKADKILIMVQTGVSDISLLSKALEIGANGSINKPYQVEELLEKLDQMIDSRKK